MLASKEVSAIGLRYASWSPPGTGQNCCYAL